MSIKKILIVPSEMLVEKEPSSRAARFLVRGAKRLKRKISGTSSLYDAELQRYADVPAILGRENAFIYGALYPHLYSDYIPETSPYPSCHGSLRGTTVYREDISSLMGKVDAVLVSVRAGARGDECIREARKRGVPVALIDAYDHQSNYGAADVWGELFRGYERGKHFDLYFKNDLPLGYRTNDVLPLAPCPLRVESYQFRAMPKSTDIFFSGKTRNRDQADGPAVLDLIMCFFPNVELLGHKTHGSFLTLRTYWDKLSGAKMALSPSRFVWDSFRHCEAALAPGTALIAPRPYVETVGPPLRDGVNAILYDTEFDPSDGRYHLKNGADLIEKIRSYLDNPGARERLAAAWATDVRAGHTIRARSQYILEEVGRLR